MMMKNRTNNRMKWNYTLTLPALFLAMMALSVPKLNATIPEKESVKVVMRGIDSIKNRLLIFIDEKKVTGEELNKLNPNDIESITVLKDKSAVNLYGEEGKNGVVIIKLKKSEKELVE